MNIAELRKKSSRKEVQRPPAPGAAPETTPFAAERCALNVALPSTASPPLSPPVAAPATDAEGQAWLEPPPSPAATPLIAAAAPPLRRNRLDELFAADLHQQLHGEGQLLDGTWSQAPAVEEFRQMLSFSLGDEEYALDINDIREIIKPREITDLPRVPHFVLGIISLRGIVIPVFDLKRRFNLGTSILSPTSRIIVCQRDSKSAGLLVDSISQVLRIPCASIEPPPPVLSGLERELLEGVGRYQERMLILLNMPCVLNIDLI